MNEAILVEVGPQGMPQHRGVRASDGGFGIEQLIFNL
jgi:hypothetical protein